MYQKIMIVGYLGKDPEMRYFDDGTPVTNFSVATSRKYTGKDGQQVDETTWFRVSVTGKQAENCNTYLSKGRPVLVEGRLQSDAGGNPRVWTRDDGTSSASYEIRANVVRFLPGRGEDEGSYQVKEEGEADIPF